MKDYLKINLKDDGKIKKYRVFCFWEKYGGFFQKMMKNINKGK